MFWIVVVATITVVLLALAWWDHTRKGTRSRPRIAMSRRPTPEQLAMKHPAAADHRARSTFGPGGNIIG